MKLKSGNKGDNINCFPIKLFVRLFIYFVVL